MSFSKSAEDFYLQCFSDWLVWSSGSCRSDVVLAVAAKKFFPFGLKRRTSLVLLLLLKKKKKKRSTKSLRFMWCRKWVLFPHARASWTTDLLCDVPLLFCSVVRVKYSPALCCYVLMWLELNLINHISCSVCFVKAWRLKTITQPLSSLNTYCQMAICSLF